MMGKEAVYFDPETVALLRETLDDAWACLSPELQATMPKTLACYCIGPSRLSGAAGRRRKQKAKAVA